MSIKKIETKINKYITKKVIYECDVCKKNYQTSYKCEYCGTETCFRCSSWNDLTSHEEWETRVRVCKKCYPHFNIYRSKRYELQLYYDAELERALDELDKTFRKDSIGGYD